MRIFSYRNKRTLRRIALIALLAVVLLGLLILARISYLGRYVVYSPNGVYFDKTQKLQRTPQTPEAPADAEDYPFETILSAAAEETAADCRALGVQAITLQADVRSPEACQNLVEDTAAAFGRIDVLVNNAGITADKLLLRMTEADFDNVLAANLKGAFFCTKAATRFMMHQRYGRIVSVSSVVGLHGNAGQANYAASKAGLIGLTKSAAKEYAARNITANVVAPGFIATDMTAVLSEPARAAAEAAIPAGKIGHTEDVAAAVAFLAGEQAGYITGQVLCVDGGMGM